MIAMRGLLFMFAALLSATPAIAIPPVPIETYTYYGPVRHCGNGFALDVREGEGLLHSTSGSAYVLSGRGDLSVERARASDPVRDLALYQPDGSLVVGANQFNRFRLTALTGPGPRIGYRIDLADGSYAPMLVVRSDRFTGGDDDAESLRRISIGEEAAALCADVPVALRATAERQNEDAFWLRPTRFAGPLTICFDKLALDVRQGEAAYLPWRDDAQRFAVLTGTMEVGIAGGFNEDSHGSAPPDGPLATDLRYRVTAGAPPWTESVISTFMRAKVPATNRARLVAVVDQKRIGPDPGPGLSFGFNRPLSDDERNAFIGRVRARTPADRCFDPDFP